MPEARRLGEAQAVEGRQLEGFRQDELAAGWRSGAVLAVAEELTDALPQQLVLAGCQRAAWDVSAHPPRCQVGLCVQVCTLEDLSQQLCSGQSQVVHPATTHTHSHTHSADSDTATVDANKSKACLATTHTPSRDSTTADAKNIEHA